MTVRKNENGGTSGGRYVVRNLEEGKETSAN
jgi:hypothetical protein